MKQFCFNENVLSFKRILFYTQYLPFPQDSVALDAVQSAKVIDRHPVFISDSRQRVAFSHTVRDIFRPVLGAFIPAVS